MKSSLYLIPALLLSTAAIAESNTLSTFDIDTLIEHKVFVTNTGEYFVNMEILITDGTTDTPYYGRYNRSETDGPMQPYSSVATRDLHGGVPHEMGRFWIHKMEFYDTNGVLVYEHKTDNEHSFAEQCHVDVEADVLYSGEYPKLNISLKIEDNVDATKNYTIECEFKHPDEINEFVVIK